MENKIIEFENELSGKTIWFFSKSQGNLFRNHGNTYTCKARGKYVIVDREIAKNFPDNCYLKINKIIEKENVYIVTDAYLIIPSSTTSNNISHFDLLTLVRREDYAIKNTIKYYNCKSKKGDINCLIVTYKMKNVGDPQKIYFDNYINFNGKIISVEIPDNIYNFYKYSNINNFASVDYYDFKQIK